MNVRVKSKLEQKIDDEIEDNYRGKVDFVKDDLEQLSQFFAFAERLIEQIQTSDTVSLSLARDVGYAQFWLEEHEASLERFQKIIYVINKTEIKP
jgi:hypothetical protein